MSVPIIQTVIPLAAVATGGGLTILGLFVNSSITQSRELKDSKNQLIGQILSSRLKVSLMQHELRFSEINLFLFNREDKILQDAPISTRPINYDELHQHNIDEINYHRDLSEQYKSRVTDAYVELNLLLTNIQQAFTQNKEVEAQTNILLGLSMPDVEIPDASVDSSIKVVSWADGARQRVQGTIEETFLTEMDKLVALVKSQLQKTVKSTAAEPRIITFIRGLWLTFKD